MARPWTKVRSDIAVAHRKDPNADTTELKRELKESRLEDYIARTVAEWPPLTTEQLDRLALLLRGADTSAPPTRGGVG
ncbi:hypothetical protein [Intrasporangium sp.]|uniref:hypothetical protein n=1 Tax=Intrasporangium sp. TaxID=1925024 RepID=UPI00322157E2